MKYFKMIIYFFLIMTFFNFKTVYANKLTNIYINGYLLKSDVDPIIINSTTFVPIRPLGESLNFTFDFDDETKSLVMFQNDLDIKIEMGVLNNIAIVNENKQELTEPPIILNNRLLVPLRFISETLNSKVTWEESFDINSPNRVIIKNSYPISLYTKNAKIASKEIVWEKSIKSFAQDKKYSYEISLPIFSDMENKTLENKLNEIFNIRINSIIEEIRNTYQTNLNTDSQLIYDFTFFLDYLIVSDYRNLLAIKVIEETYSGGAHGTLSEFVINIDIDKSKMIEIADIFILEKDFESVLYKEMNDIIKNNINEEYENITNPTFIYSDCFYFEDDFLVIFYAPYDLAAFSRGFVEFRIPLENLKDYLIEDYKNLH